MKAVYARRSGMRTGLLAIGYIAVVLLSLYAGPASMDMGVRIFGPSFLKISDLAILLMLSVIFINLIRDDIAHKRIKDLFRYPWLITLGAVIMASAAKLEGRFDRLHVVEYLLIGLMTFRVLYSQVKTRTVYLMVVISIAAFAGLEEMIQVIIPGRGFEFSDLCVDIWSAMLALLIIDLAIMPTYKLSMVERRFKRYLRRNKDRIWINMKYFWYEMESRISKLFR